jgi:hypothetical protein
MSSIGNKILRNLQALGARSVLALRIHVHNPMQQQKLQLTQIITSAPGATNLPMHDRITAAPPHTPAAAPQASATEPSLITAPLAPAPNASASPAPV